MSSAMTSLKNSVTGAVRKWIVGREAVPMGRKIDPDTAIVTWQIRIQCPVSPAGQDPMHQQRCRLARRIGLEMKFVHSSFRPPA